MKFKISLVLFLALWSSVAVAQTSPRNVLIGRIESISSHTIYSADSPLIEGLLVAAKVANPGVNSDTWADIKRETALTLSDFMAERGGSLDLRLRPSLETLSDAELERLCQILGDPVYNKFQRTLITPHAENTQGQILKAMTDEALKYNATINSVLKRHGLNKMQ